MQQRFGFIASEKLITLIKEANQRLEAGNNPKDPMYPYRNRLIEQVSEELIENLVIKQGDQFADEKRKQHMVKMGHTLQNIIGKIVHVMLSKDKDSVVLESRDFLDKTVALDDSGNVRVGLPVPEEFYNRLMACFGKVEDGEYTPEILKETQEHLKFFDEKLLTHFIIDFVQTLGWGSIKMKVAKATKSAITKADNKMIDQMIPKLPADELQRVARYLYSLFYQTDKVGASYIV